MKLSRVLILVAFTLLCTGWLQADIDTSHFIFNLNDPIGSTPNPDPNGLGGWDPFEGFTGTATPSVSIPEGIFNNSITLFCDSGPCFPSDPWISLKIGGASTGVTGDSFSFSADGGNATNDPMTAGGTGEPFAFQNLTGHTISSMEVTTTLDTSNFSDSITFHCVTDAFANCGFTFDNTDLVIHTFFYGGSGLASGSVPEPSSWLLFGTAAAAIFWRRARKHVAR